MKGISIRLRTLYVFLEGPRALLQKREILIVKSMERNHSGSDESIGPVNKTFFVI